MRNSMSRALCLILSLFSVVLLYQPTAGQPPGNPPIPPAELFGGIEISPKVVRGVVLRIIETADGGNVQILYSLSTATLTQSYLKDGNLTPDYIREATQSVQKTFRQLKSQYPIPETQIHLLALSGFAAGNLDSLGEEIERNTGRPVAFISSQTEIELGIAGTIPRRFRSGNKVFDNRSVAILLEVGDTAIRGGYQEIRLRPPAPPEYEFVTVNIAKGLSNFSSEINQSVGETADLTSFARAAILNSPSLFRPLLQNEIARKPALLTRNRVYLTGEIVWAMMTLLHPEDQSNYAAITMDDIRTFHNRAVVDPDSLLNPDLSKLRDETYRAEMRRARDYIKQAYPPKSLVAGAELLRFLAGEMQFQNRTVIYPRNAWLARILSYVRLRPD